MYKNNYVFLQTLYFAKFLGSFRAKFAWSLAKFAQSFNEIRLKFVQSSSEVHTKFILLNETYFHAYHTY